MKIESNKIVANNSLKIYVSENRYDVYITGSILNSYKYIDLIYLLGTCPNENDIKSFFIFIDSPGGNSNYATQIATAIKKSNYNVNCIVMGDCCSSANFIALAGDYLSLQPNTCMFFHNYSKKFEELQAYSLKKYLENIDKLLNNQFEYFLLPFLTNLEMDSIKHDGEIYIHSDDLSLKDRLDRHFHKKYPSQTLQEVHNFQQELWETQYMKINI